MSFPRLRSFAAWIYVPLLGIAGLLLVHPWRWPAGVDPVTLIVLILLFAVGEIAVIRFRGGATTLSFSIAFAAFHLFGATAAIWVAGLGALVATVARRRPLRAAMGNLGFCAAGAAVAGWLADSAGLVPGLTGERFWVDVLNLVLYSQAFFWTNVLLLEGLIWLRHGRPTWNQWLANVKLQLAALGICVGYGLFFLVSNPPTSLVRLVVLFLPLIVIGLFWQASHDLSRSRRRHAFLFDMAGHLTAAQSLSHTTSGLLASLQQVIPYDHAALLVRLPSDRERPDEVLRVVGLRSPALPHPGSVYRVRSGPIWKALRSGRAERIDDMSREKGWAPPKALAGVRAVLLVPICIGDQVRGLIALGSDLSHAFFPEDLQLLTVLANQFGTVIQNLEVLEHREQLAVTGERNRLAREIHDGLAQQLAGTLFQLEQVARQGRLFAPEAEQAVRQASLSIRGALQEVRRSIYDLRPHPLQEQPFLPAVRRLVQELGQDDGLQVSFQTTGRPRRLKPVAEDSLFQVLGESLNNVRKHAAAKNVQVELRFRPEGVRLMIQDDGCGFELLPAIGGAPSGERVGIIGMYERLKLVDGRLVIDSQPGKGTRLDVEIPYQAREQGSSAEVG